MSSNPTSSTPRRSWRGRNAVPTPDAVTSAAAGSRCMIPGCPDPASDAREDVTLPAISLGSGKVMQAFAGEVRSRGLRWAALNCATRLLWIAWRFVRQVSGDDAYERYREHMAHLHAGQRTMTRSEYFRFCQDQKWNRITRCC